MLSHLSSKLGSWRPTWPLRQSGIGGQKFGNEVQRGPFNGFGAAPWGLGGSNTIP